MTLTAPPSVTTNDVDEEALFKEAKRRRRNRWLAGALTLVAIAGASALIATSGSGPPQRPPRKTLSTDRGSIPPIRGAITLKANGIGRASFGQPEAAAIASLEQMLGAPPSSTPTPSNNCTIDSLLRWATIAAYFDHQRFVGYSTVWLTGRPENRGDTDFVTSAGLRLGDTLSQARRLYGTALRTSYEQGGAWFATTPSGTLAGNLTNEVNETSPTPQINDITAGSVGCPAMSP
jgi:hypothetical protein